MEMGGLPPWEFAVAETFGFSCLGFFVSFLLFLPLAMVMLSRFGAVLCGNRAGRVLNPVGVAQMLVISGRQRPCHTRSRVGCRLLALCFGTDVNHAPVPAIWQDICATQSPVSASVCPLKIAPAGRCAQVYRLWGRGMMRISLSIKVNA